MSFDLQRLLLDVFEPDPGEHALVIADVPARPGDDSISYPAGEP